MRSILLPLLVPGLIACLLPRSACAQEAGTEIPAAGFLEMVNLVSLREPTFLRLGSFELNGGDPVSAGGTSGVLAIRPGEYEFEISNAGATPGKLRGRLSVADGRNTVLICYDTYEENRDGESETKLRYTLLIENPENDGARLTLVSLAKKPFLSVRLGDTTVTLQERMAHPHPVKIGDALVLGSGGRRIEEIEIEDAVHYIAFLYQNPETGDIELSLIRNEKLEYHPPIEDEKEQKENQEG